MSSSGTHENQKAHWFPPGHSGNPSGRPEGVTYPGDWIRGLLGLTESELREIVNDPKAVISKRMAALALIRSAAHADMADFEPVLLNRETLTELRIKGIDTTMVKKANYNATDKGLSVSIELHDRSKEVDRILERTEGRPTQYKQVEITDTRTAKQLVEEGRRIAGTKAPKEE
jgi:hypothetical protein